MAVWALALWLAGPGNLTLWRAVWHLNLAPGPRAAAFVTLAGLVLGATAALLWLLAWPRIWRPAASVLVLTAAANAYFMGQFGAVIDASMLTNVLRTDAREAADLLSWPLLGTLLGLAGPPLWWVWRHPPAWRRGWRQAWRPPLAALLALTLAVASAALGYAHLASLMRNHKTLRYQINPLNTVVAGAKLVADALPRQAQPRQPVGEDAQWVPGGFHPQRSPLLVLVVGETARAQNWGLNGYERATTPRLARWQAEQGLLNFPDVRSCGTNTEVSVPCMFSPLTRDAGGNRPAMHDNLLDVLQRAGLAVLWLDNQSGCKGVCDRVPHASTRELALPGLCDDDGCRDEALLHDLDARLAALDPARRARGVVLVLHLMGSHGPAYFKRSPAAHKPFGPECTSQTLADCSVQEVRNAYDNSVAYTDLVLDRTLQWLQTQTPHHTPGLLFVSDHGESLGENGLYLHGLPYALAPDEQTRVPMVAWLAPAWSQGQGMKAACLQGRTQAALSHDHLFHTVLGLMQVRTRAYEPGLDALAACRAG